MTLIAPTGLSNDKGASADIVIPGPGASAGNGVAVSWWWKGDSAADIFADFRTIMAVSTASTNNFRVVGNVSSSNQVFELTVAKTTTSGFIRSAALQSFISESAWNLFGIFLQPGQHARFRVNNNSLSFTFENVTGDGVTADSTTNFWVGRNPNASGRRGPLGKYADICIWENLPLSADFDALMDELATPVDPESVVSSATLLHRWPLTTSLERTAGSGTASESTSGIFVLDTGGTPMSFDGADTDLPDHLSVGEPSATVTIDGDAVADDGTVVLDVVRIDLRYDLDIIIGNDGTDTLEISSVALSGTDAGVVEILTEPAATVLTGQSTTMTLRILQDTAELIEFTLTINSDDPVSPAFVVNFEADVGVPVPVEPPVTGTGVHALDPNRYSLVILPWSAKNYSNPPDWFPPAASISPGPSSDPMVVAQSVIDQWRARGYGTKWKSGSILVQDPNGSPRFAWSPGAPSVTPSSNINTPIDTGETEYWFRAFFSFLPVTSVACVYTNIEGYSIFSIGGSGWPTRYEWASAANSTTITEMEDRVGVDLSNVANQTTENQERLGSFCFQRLLAASYDSIIVPMLERFPDALYFNYNDQAHRNIPLPNTGAPFPYPQGTLNTQGQISSTNLYARINSPFTAAAAIAAMEANLLSAELSQEKGPNFPWLPYAGFAQVASAAEYHPEDLRAHWISMFNRAYDQGIAWNGNKIFCLFNPQGDASSTIRERNHESLDLTDRVTVLRLRSTRRRARSRRWRGGRTL